MALRSVYPFRFGKRVKFVGILIEQMAPHLRFRAPPFRSGLVKSSEIRRPKRIRRAGLVRSGGMNELQIKGNWNVIKGKLKQAYRGLTDDDLAYSEGNEDQLVGRLQQKLGKTKEEICRAINEASM